MRKSKFLSWTLALYVVLGCWKGHLAVFEGASPEPRQIYPLKIETLGEEDQQALTAGILIRSPKRLDELLEAYLS